MKILGRIALVIAIVACIGAIVFANKLGATRDALVVDKTQLTADKAKLNTELASTRTELGNTKQALVKANDDITTANGVIDGLKTSLATKSKEAEGLKATVAEKEHDVQVAKTELTAVQDKLKQIQDVTESDDFKHVKQIREQLNTQTEENKLLAQQMLSMKTDIDGLKQRITDLTTTPINLRGHVAAVQDSWGFIVLDMGRDQRVQTNTDFLVYRDTKLVSKVQVRSVGETTSVAEILPDFAHPKASIKPKVGDLVVH